MTDLTWIAPTILALGSLVGSIVAAVVALRISKKQEGIDGKVSLIDVKVDDVKKATDGILHRAVADAAQKGRKEGAAIATAGAKAAKKP